jgi:ELWxxDGT repeat protein
VTNVNGTLFFTATDGTHGYELWKSDGTAAGTVLVSDINPGPGGSFPSGFSININGTLFFGANDALHGSELWKSDGTTAGTVIVQDINTVTTAADQHPSPLANVNGTVYFSANDGTHGREPWKTDGTAAGTLLVSDINPGSDSSINVDYAPDFVEFTNVNGTVFFNARSGSYGDYELWKSDGTAAGTVLLSDINPQGGYGSYLANLTNVNGTLFFTARDVDRGEELWKSDGTAAGTGLVKDILPSSNISPFDLVNVNGTLFFTAVDVSHGYELWKSDGTAAGTVMVSDIWPGRESSYPGSLTNINGTLFFNANDGVHGSELWKSDGTAAGTVLVSDINPGSNGSYPGPFNNVNGTLFFSANDGTHRYELWKSDGTAAGTVLVSDINLGSDGRTLNETNVNGTLFFSANDGFRYGNELWKSDGTTAGTVLVSDIRPGQYGSYPTNLTNVNGTLFFNADDGTHGKELWESDGTAAGTFLVGDINPGPNSSNPNDLTNVNGTLFFEATDGTHGFQLWDLVGPATALQTTAPATAVAGVPFTITVTPVDSTGHDVMNYSGTVHFSSTDPQATLPADYTFTSADQGVHTFTGIVFDKAGVQTLTITDTATSSITGSAAVNVSPGPVSGFFLTNPPPYNTPTAGKPTSFAVTAVDAFNNVVAAYTGTVHIATTDTQATVPADYTFTLADNGTHIFSGLVLRTAGTITITASDTAASSVKGTTTDQVSPAAASMFQMTAFSSILAGAPSTVMVEALDPYGNLVTGYLGTVHFKSSDPSAVLPGDYTFTSADQGQHTFSVVWNTVGTQTLVMRDTVLQRLSGRITVTVPQQSVEDWPAAALDAWFEQAALVFEQQRWHAGGNHGLRGFHW